jgi:hypothetical protein
MQSGEIMILVAGAAFDGIRATAVVSAANLHCVAMAVVALTGKVSARVAIHATRVAKHRNNCFESRSGTGIVARYGFMNEMFSGMPRSLNGNQEEKRQGTIDRRAGEDRRDGFSALHTFPALRVFSSSAAFTRCGVNGNSRRRAPVASKMAFPIAAGITVIAVSPAPVAGTSGGVKKTVSIVGIS